MIVVMGGVAGSGKSTVGALLAEKLHWRFVDADAFHPDANVAKMRAGIPLTDADRRPWLAAITTVMDEWIAAGVSAVAGCSALKRSYRDKLLTGRPEAWLAFLEISREAAHARLAARNGHFFTAKLMNSQFGELEPPQPDEQRVVLLDACHPADQLVDEIIDRLGLVATPAAAPQQPARPERPQRPGGE
jgi:gluconokinase